MTDDQQPTFASGGGIRTTFVLLFLLALASTLLLRMGGIAVLAFSSDHLLANGIGQILPTGLCLIALAVLASTKRTLLGIGIFFATILGFIIPNCLGETKILAGLYLFQIRLEDDFSRRCQPPAGISLKSVVVRICERRDWYNGEQTAVVLKVDGNSPSFELRDLDNPKAPTALQKLAPFGIAKFNFTKILNGYYVVVFCNGIPPGAPHFGC